MVTAMCNVQLTMRRKDGRRLNDLKVLRDARVALLREHTGVFDSRVPPRRHVAYYGLLLSRVGIIVGVWIRLVVTLVVVFLGIAMLHTGILARIVRPVSRRIG